MVRSYQPKRKVKSFTPKERNTARHIDSHRIDIKGGKLTFGQRIELGKIFQSGLSPAETFCKVFEALHGYTPETSEYGKLYPYFEEITAGLQFWFEQEKLLEYKPTSEETQAGIKELSESIGEFGTIKALAKTYHTDPDVILTWQYGKVFGILYTDMKEFEYQRRYDKVIENKYKHKFK
ncbi:MAG: hypothetical protein LBH19_02405 [Dysgonamonadaceae bacterium]|jgi:hypothetical protein|nr:hypothetical protein [Dysgonamonadaceae bacterium]